MYNFTSKSSFIVFSVMCLSSHMFWVFFSSFSIIRKKKKSYLNILSGILWYIWKLPVLSYLRNACSVEQIKQNFTFILDNWVPNYTKVMWERNTESDPELWVENNGIILIKIHIKMCYPVLPKSLADLYGSNNHKICRLKIQ